MCFHTKKRTLPMTASRCATLSTAAITLSASKAPWPCRAPSTRYWRHAESMPLTIGSMSAAGRGDSARAARFQSPSRMRRSISAFVSALGWRAIHVANARLPIASRSRSTATDPPDQAP